MRDANIYITCRFRSPPLGQQEKNKNKNKTPACGYHVQNTASILAPPSPGIQSPVRDAMQRLRALCHPQFNARFTTSYHHEGPIDVYLASPQLPDERSDGGEARCRVENDPLRVGVDVEAARPY
jgi:hypothetical protein